MNTTQYFELDGVPMRRRAASIWPEVYRSSGVWERCDEPIRLLCAGTRIGERAAAELIERWDRMVAGKAA